MVKGLCVKPLKGDAVLFWSMVCDFVSMMMLTVMCQCMCLQYLILISELMRRVLVYAAVYLCLSGS